jgi:hypothetical protein
MKNTIQTHWLAGCLLAVIAASNQPTGAQPVWSGASGNDLNWSTPGNWLAGAAPGPNDDVLFTDAGTAASAGVVNNEVDTNIPGTIQSLQ